MDLKNPYAMKQLIASCPNCQGSTLYGGKIESKKKDLDGTEVLFCKSCKFVMSVKKYKKMLFSV